MGQASTEGTAIVFQEADRLVVACDNCPIRLDLGPAHAARARNRMPSGWINAGRERHYCTSCSPSVTAALLAAAARKNLRPQPLV